MEVASGSEVEDCAEMLEDGFGGREESDRAVLVARKPAGLPEEQPDSRDLVGEVEFLPTVELPVIPGPARERSDRTSRPR